MSHDLKQLGKFQKEIWMDWIKHKWRQATINKSNVSSCWTGKGNLPGPIKLKSGVKRNTLYLTVPSGLVLRFNGAEIWKANRCYCSHYPPNPGALHPNMHLIYCWFFAGILGMLSISFLFYLYNFIYFLIEWLRPFIHGMNFSDALVEVWAGVPELQREVLIINRGWNKHISQCSGIAFCVRHLVVIWLLCLSEQIFLRWKERIISRVFKWPIVLHHRPNPMDKYYCIF